MSHTKRVFLVLFGVALLALVPMAIANLTVQPQVTKTTVSCKPNSTVANSADTIVCTARVTGNSPTGDVSWSPPATPGLVSLSSTTCTLTKGVCSVNASGTKAGRVILKATYKGDLNNKESSGQAMLIIKPGDLVQYCFSPKHFCDKVLVSWINSAKSSIHVLIYSFTIDDVKDALIAAHSRGVDVRVVMEKTNVNEANSEYYALKNASISVRWDTNAGQMHNKFAVIDGHFIITGSFNWTKAATDSNNENLVVINSVPWGAAFENDFQSVYDVAVAG